MEDEEKKAKAKQKKAEFLASVLASEFGHFTLKLSISVSIIV